MRLAHRAAVVALLCSACATAGGLKGGEMVPFAPAGITDGDVGQRHALLIGINEFEDDAFTDLTYAARDASALGDALTDFDSVELLTDPALTNATGIRQALAQLAERARGASDTVIVYISGHGTLARRPGHQLERYVVAADTRLDDVPGTGLPLDEIVAQVEAMAPRRKAVVLAMCHSGIGKSAIDESLAEALAAQKGPAVVPPLMEVSEAMVVVAAAAFGEAAREDETLGHDIYTHFLLEGLRKADRNGDGAVTITEAHDYARDRTYRFTSGGQRPTAETRMLGSDPIVLAGRRVSVGKSEIYSYDPAAEGLILEIDGTTKGALPGGLAVAPGSHTLRIKDAVSEATVFEGEVQIRADERVALHDLVATSNPNAVAVHAGVLWLPLDSGASDLLPAMPVLSLELSRRFDRYSGPVARGQFTFATGSDTEPSGPDFDVFLVEVGAGGGWMWLHRGALTTTLTALASRVWAQRTPATEPAQSITAWSSRGVLTIGWSPTDELGLHARGELGVLAGTVGEADYHPLAMVGLGGAWTF
jgi:hypothetical protein